MREHLRPQASCGGRPGEARVRARHERLAQRLLRLENKTLQ